MSTIREELERIRRMADPKKGERNRSSVVARANDAPAHGRAAVNQLWGVTLSDEDFRRLWLKEGRGDVARFARLIGDSGLQRVRNRLRYLGLLAP